MSKLTATQMKSIEITSVTLRIRDAGRQLSFYRDVLGFSVLEKKSTIELRTGGSNHPLVVLEVSPDAPPRSRQWTGLFHVAFRFPSRKSLAMIFQRLYEMRHPFEGFADHGVSEAIYTADPEGNGIELYWDKPKQRWPFRNGELVMVTDPLDLENLTSELDPGERWHELDPGMDIGHVHMNVSNLPIAEEFYCGLMGLDVMQRSYPGALFMSAGGYHHHVAVNTWAGRTMPPPGTSGLSAYAMVVRNKEDADGLALRIHGRSQFVDGAHRLMDPNGIPVNISFDTSSTNG